MLQKSNLQAIDFGALYKEQKSVSAFKIKDANDWDKKASGMNERVFKSLYTQEFLQKVVTKGAKTLLDIGCGPGTLGINLAPSLQHVYCLDFSSKMLEYVEENAKLKNLRNITTLQKSFNHDWNDVPKCDILIASRCMEVADLETTLKKINKHGKKIYISYKVGGSFLHKDIINLLEREIMPKPDYMYLVNILYALGYTPKIEFIRSEESLFKATSKEKFLEQIKWSVGELSKNEASKILQFFDEKIKDKIDRNIYNTWALVAYET